MCIATHTIQPAERQIKVWHMSWMSKWQGWHAETMKNISKCQATMRKCLVLKLIWMEYIRSWLAGKLSEWLKYVVSVDLIDLPLLCCGDGGLLYHLLQFTQPLAPPPHLLHVPLLICCCFLPCILHHKARMNKWINKHWKELKDEKMSWRNIYTSRQLTTDRPTLQTMTTIKTDNVWPQLLNVWQCSACVGVAKNLEQPQDLQPLF